MAFSIICCFILKKQNTCIVTVLSDSGIILRKMIDPLQCDLIYIFGCMTPPAPLSGIKFTVEPWQEDAQVFLSVRIPTLPKL